MVPFPENYIRMAYVSLLLSIFIFSDDKIVICDLFITIFSYKLFIIMDNLK